MTDVDMLETLELFRGLNGEQRRAIQKLMKPRPVMRGRALVVEGEPSDALFIVLHGAFEVRRSDVPGPIARIRAGEVIGEIGFFSGTTRTASATAIRDAMVLELDRRAYDDLLIKAPSIQTALLSALASRLDKTTARLSLRPTPQQARTVAIIQGGCEPIPPRFIEMLRTALSPPGFCIVDREFVETRFGNNNLDSDEIRRRLNSLEWENRLVVYFADRELTEWTSRCIRQADEVVMAVRGRAPAGKPTPVESLVCEVHPGSARRLVRVHDSRRSAVSGTADWLRRMDVSLHHHVALEDDADVMALVRFLTGRAVGFVAGGGGGFGPAHTGIGKAFQEQGVRFDIFIGTSVGAAILAGFAMRHSPEQIDQATHDIFIAGRSFKRPTLPKYALLDHKAFDSALARNIGPDLDVEDCWHPFFAVATNLSCQRLELIRTGRVWKAVRSSSSIPGLLPPVFTEDGTMLVDGGIMDNAPLAPLKDIKAGPNLVVHFGCAEEQRFACRYEDIPGRGDLIFSLLNPFRRRRLPKVPNTADVLIRSLMAHQNYDLPAGTEDLVLRPPDFPGSALLNFDHHRSVFQASYKWALAEIEELDRSGNRAFAALRNPTHQVGPGGDS